MRSEQSTERRYLRIFMLSFVVVLGAAASFCMLVDPYGIFDTPRLPNLNAVKSAAAARLRLSKAYRIAFADPATLVTGNSVTNLGIDPDSPAWRPQHRPVFNLGIDGAPLAEQRRYLLNALTVSHPRLVVLFTSFEDIMPSDATDASVFQPELRALDDGRPNPQFSLRHLRDLASATLSFRAISDSALTLVRQSGDGINYQRGDGFEINAPEERYAATQGVRAAIAKMDQDIALRIMAWSRHPEWSLEPLAAMIHAARAAGADVVVAIPPNLADLSEVRRQLGLSGTVEAWRSALIGLVADEAATLGGPDKVRLWDFSGASSYTLEEPPAGAGMADRWFWDTAHFSPRLGSLLIQRLENEGGPADLGTRLEAADDALHAAGAVATERAWVAGHPQDVDRISELLAATHRHRCQHDPATCAPPAILHVAAGAATP